MTQEEKELLIKDLCGRLPYDVIVQETFQSAQRDVPVWDCGPHYIKDHPEKVKPYLRPMESMTEEERLELSRLTGDKFKFYLYTREPQIICYEKYNYFEGLKVLDWLNAHHFDYRGLIPMNLALPAPDGMYNKKEEGE